MRRCVMPLSPWISGKYLLRSTRPLSTKASPSNEAAGPQADSPPPQANTIAWVQSIRKHKTKTFLDVNDGSSPKNLQVSEGTSRTCPRFNCYFVLLKISSTFRGVCQLKKRSSLSTRVL